MRQEWILDILAVHDCGSLSAAAEQRLLTPSAFSRRLRLIEHEVGGALFDRSRKPIALLPHVAGLETEMREVAAQLRALRLGLAEASDDRAERLSLGCQHALSATLAPELVAAMQDRANLNVRLRTGSRSDCLLMLIRREIDFALVYETAFDPIRIDNRHFGKTEIGTDAFVPVCSPAARDRLEAEMAAGILPAVLYPPSIFLGEVQRRAILPALAPGLHVRVVAETGLSLAITEFLRKGLGIGWLPQSVAAPALARGELELMSGALPECPLDVFLLHLEPGKTGQVSDLRGEILRAVATARGIDRRPE